MNRAHDCNREEVGKGTLTGKLLETRQLVLLKETIHVCSENYVNALYLRSRADVTNKRIPSLPHMRIINPDTKYEWSASCSGFFASSGIHWVAERMCVLLRRQMHHDQNSE